MPHEKVDIASNKVYAECKLHKLNEKGEKVEKLEASM